jgi:hypothetical protein
MRLRYVYENQVVFFYHCVHRLFCHPPLIGQRMTHICTITSSLAPAPVDSIRRFCMSQTKLIDPISRRFQKGFITTKHHTKGVGTSKGGSGQDKEIFFLQ